MALYYCQSLLDQACLALALRAMWPLLVLFSHMALIWPLLTYLVLPALNTMAIIRSLYSGHGPVPGSVPGSVPDDSARTVPEHRPEQGLECRYGHMALYLVLSTVIYVRGIL